MAEAETAASSATVRGYAICTTPRSGSSILAEMLSATGRLGNPRESFNRFGSLSRELYGGRWDIEERFTDIMTRGATPNGVYALKVFTHQHDEVAKLEKWTARLPEMRHVVLRRGDMLAQAISWARARQTGSFSSAQPEKAAPEYSARQIRKRLRLILESNARWDAYFAANGLKPLRLQYEDVIRDPQAAIDAIAALMGVSGPCRYDAATLKHERQADSINAQWRERFVAEHRNADIIPHWKLVRPGWRAFWSFD
jgi:trehalose 2-sulfotransferase